MIRQLEIRELLYITLLSYPLCMKKQLYQLVDTSDSYDKKEDINQLIRVKATLSDRAMNTESYLTPHPVVER